MASKNYPNGKGLRNAFVLTKKIKHYFHTRNPNYAFQSEDSKLTVLHKTILYELKNLQSSRFEPLLYILKLLSNLAGLLYF